MRVSQYFNLGADQSSLDFVDVDVRDDVPVFIDPSAIRVQKGDWAAGCQEDLRSFFEELLAAIGGTGKHTVADLIWPLVEPNETHMGLSEGRSRGRGLGNEGTSQKLIQALKQSKAATSGLLEDLEDTALFVDGIGRDILSDMATCIIRGRLIEYTGRMCAFHGIATTEVQTPPIWDSNERAWNLLSSARLPRPYENQLVLVPRSIVRVSPTVDKGKYYRDFLRPYYEQQELNNPASGLVRVLKDRRRRVSIKELDKTLGTSKKDLVRNTIPHPEALTDYRTSLGDRVSAPMTGNQLADRLGTPRVDYQELLDEVLSVRPGRAGANPYHRSVSKLLTALFESSLGNMRLEEEIHEGRKRIDITFDNVAESGFFRWLSLHYACAKILVECKNYDGEIGNPEVDQLAMRFSEQRGTIGILVYREVRDRKRLVDRCRSVTRDRHGYILLLDDNDLQLLTEEAMGEVGVVGSTRDNAFALLRGQFESLLMN